MNLKHNSMKRIIILSLVLMILIIFGMDVNSSVRLNTMSIGNTKSDIHYQINIHPNLAIIQSSCPMMVSLTDGSGNNIGQPKLYNPSQNSYHFYEMGPVSGIRMARLVNIEERFSDNVCVLVSLKDSKSGTFNNGWRYVFNLYGSVKDIINQNNSNETQ